MNFEALGQYHHYKEMRQAALHKLYTQGRAVAALGRSLDGYRPPYPGADSIQDDIARAEVAIPEIKALVQQVAELWREMESLRIEFNLNG